VNAAVWLPTGQRVFHPLVSDANFDICKVMERLFIKGGLY
jgi:hypothetical protein